MHVYFSFLNICVWETSTTHILDDGEMISTFIYALTGFEQTFMHSIYFQNISGKLFHMLVQTTYAFQKAMSITYLTSVFLSPTQNLFTQLGPTGQCGKVSFFIFLDRRLCIQCRD